MRKTIIGIFLVCMIAISIAGITGTIGTVEPIVKDKEIPDEQYVELKSVLEKGGVTIDDKIGLDIQWKELSCKEDKNNETCEYALYKENLFNGATIKVTYPIGVENKQALLDQAIQNKVEFVKSVWETRQAVTEAEKDTNESQTGTTKFVSDKKEIEEPKE